MLPNALRTLLWACQQNGQLYWQHLFFIPGGHAHLEQFQLLYPPVVISPH